MVYGIKKCKLCGFLNNEIKRDKLICEYCLQNRCYSCGHKKCERKCYGCKKLICKNCQVKCGDTKIFREKCSNVICEYCKPRCTSCKCKYEKCEKHKWRYVTCKEIYCINCLKKCRDCGHLFCDFHIWNMYCKYCIF